MSDLISLDVFDGADGALPRGGLILVDGNLIGTTDTGGAHNDGTVFEAATSGGSLTTLVSFDTADGSNPSGGLIVTSSGDLLGITNGGGASSTGVVYDGTVFELAPVSGGYSNTPTTLAGFSDQNTEEGGGPNGTLLQTSGGALFGTTLAGGADESGSVFEVPAGGGTPVTVASFDGMDGTAPYGTLIADAAGDLFGTTFGGGTANDGTVYEIAATPGGHDSTPIVLASFDGTDGARPYAGLVADSAGDLFGVTGSGGLAGDGAVFEIAKQGTGYAAAPTALAAFDGADGSDPVGGLIIDAKGDLFGTTSSGGTGGVGTVFEIADTATGYAASPTTLASFDTTDGADSIAPLVADASGDLFGTTTGGGPGMGEDGTIFEVTDTGFAVACYCRGTRILTDGGEIAIEDLAIGDRVVTAGGAVKPIRWIGRRSYAGRFLEGRAHLLPILFAAGSLGDGLPRRDLRVSPAHAMLLEGVLIPAASLVNGVGITRDHACRQTDGCRVDYIHLELDEHDVILAEGAPSETFLDDDSRGLFHNAREFAALYPGAAAPGGFCAPKIEDGFVLERIRRRLAQVANGGVKTSMVK